MMARNNRVFGVAASGSMGRWVEMSHANQSNLTLQKACVFGSVRRGFSGIVSSFVGQIYRFLADLDVIRAAFSLLHGASDC